MNINERIDYTALSSYMKCPRMFYFRHVLNLERDSGPIIDLVFGLAWHSALEEGYTALRDGANLAAVFAVSCDAFQACWLKHRGDSFDYDSVAPKNPARALEMLRAYWDRFYSLDCESTILGVEVPFTLPLGDDFPNYIGRIDLIMERGNKLEIFDHKTSKYFNQTFRTSFAQSFQMDGYLTVGKVNWDKLPSVVVNGALCQKSKIDFERYTIRKQDSQTVRFLNDLRRWLRMVQSDMDILADLRDTVPDLTNPTTKDFVLPCFMRRTELACTAYFRDCSYLDLCQVRNNPETYRSKPPIGYRVSVWDPHNLDD